MTPKEAEIREATDRNITLTNIKQTQEAVKRSQEKEVGK